MSFQVAGFQTEGYQISTEVYEGPLDLLLELIERAELDITQLALAQVTDQYLEYLHALQERNAAEVSAFLVIAARLLQIKSAALLPRPPAELAATDEEDPGEALARQLIIYKRFKELAILLDERVSAGLHTYLRVAPPPKVEGKVDLTGITLDDLVTAARDIFYSQANLQPLSRVVSMPRITIRERIRVILDVIREKGKSTFRAFLSPHHSRVEVVVTFLAMLELIKRHILQAQQADLFTDIELEPIGEWSDQDETELEFKD